MAKSKLTLDDDVLLAELGIEFEEQNTSNRSQREDRIVAGFEDIERYYQQHGQLPINSEDKNIFERLYAIRLDKIRSSEECRIILTKLDNNGLLQSQKTVSDSLEYAVDDDALLAELGVLDSYDNDITKLTHVKTRAEIKAAEEIAKRTPCLDFDNFKPLFLKVQDELQCGVRKSREFKEDAGVRKGEFFILGGQKIYIAELGDEFITDYDRPDRRLRLIYDNGTESDILLRSLQRALHKDEAGRRITEPSAGPLFGNTAEGEDLKSGTIYILRSLSEHPFISEHRELIHKIGVTGGKVETRIANAANDSTYLLADVEIVATYKLYNINRAKLENIFHRVFTDAQIDLQIEDRFGKRVKPKEWFLVPLKIIDEVVNKIQENDILSYRYNPKSATLEKT